MNPNHDKKLAKDLNCSVEDLKKTRKEIYIKIKNGMLERGWKEEEIPETYEGLITYINRLKGDQISQ